MVWKLPPLNALRSFEAAARLKSFTAAADELCVTPGAISRQIKNLETFLGLDLFERTAREAKLTTSGRQYLEISTLLFSQLHGATERLLSRGERRPLRIWSSMTFSMRWLVPRLSSYHAERSGPDVILTTSLKPVDFRSGDIDIAIRYGTGTEWPGCIAIPLVKTDLVPVCSPALAASGNFRSPADLAQSTLLHSLVRIEDWRRYLEAANVTSVDPYSGMRFESSILAYSAAEQKLGFALGQRALVRDDLSAGRLAAPIDFSMRANGGFFLIYPEDHDNPKELSEFRDWIVAEAEILEG
ncbi:LysR family transcriptional regulator [Primorskyibacter flagellatus]|uniref:LysR family transcriptional regulator n=1 Tax=Primorskyibacter flagellatus TaxID=1387277 RepID=A0A917AF88_9RHOB|nr:transcriptional regulator GcvA [Primorskyibacter flagellatus]GGE46158.1 LysR family transcriptional regulator [Primorskyibacter flagellatus]